MTYALLAVEQPEGLCGVLGLVVVAIEHHGASRPDLACQDTDQPQEIRPLDDESQKDVAACKKQECLGRRVNSCALEALDAGSLQFVNSGASHLPVPPV